MAAVACLTALSILFHACAQNFAYGGTAKKMANLAIPVDRLGNVELPDLP